MTSLSAIDRSLAHARTCIAPRVTPSALKDEILAGAFVVDIRPARLREHDGKIAGAVTVERNVLEWRIDPTSAHRLPGMDDPDRRVIIMCDEGYASSLAAATLAGLGLTNVTDLEGGYQAWRSQQNDL